LENGIPQKTIPLTDHRRPSTQRMEHPTFRSAGSSTTAGSKAAAPSAGPAVDWESAPEERSRSGPAPRPARNAVCHGRTGDQWFLKGDILSLLRQGAGLDDPQRSLPTPAILIL